jgi:hypothetical protein
MSIWNLGSDAFEYTSCYFKVVTLFVRNLFRVRLPYLLLIRKCKGIIQRCKHGYECMCASVCARIINLISHHILVRWGPPGRDSTSPGTKQLYRSRFYNLRNRNIVVYIHKELDGSAVLRFVRSQKLSNFSWSPKFILPCFGRHVKPTTAFAVVGGPIQSAPMQSARVPIRTGPAWWAPYV